MRRFVAFAAALVFAAAAQAQTIRPGFAPGFRSGFQFLNAAAPRVATPVVLPTPSWSGGSTNLIAWFDTTKTLTLSDGTTSPSIFYDTVGHNSVSAWEDLTGKGNGLLQPDKSLQPTKGINGGAYFDQTPYLMTMVKGDLLNGLANATVCAMLRPDAAPGAAKRTILSATEGSTSANILTAAVSAGGSGYVVGDYITLTGGTFSNAVVLKVNAISSGAVTGVDIINPGAYTILPANPVAQGSVSATPTNPATGGVGTGATFNLAFTSIGNGSATERLDLFLSQGSTGRKPYVTTSTYDGAQFTTSTTANKSVGLANGGALADTTTKVVECYVISLAATASYLAYQNGTVDTTQTWAPTETPLTFGTGDSVAITIGNLSGATAPLGMELVALAVFSEASTAARIASITSSMQADHP